MRFRFRLALVFLLLSAFPLTLLALYSFSTSSRALRQAAEAEAALMARDLEQRVEGVSAEIDQSASTVTVIFERNLGNKRLVRFLLALVRQNLKAQKGRRVQGKGHIRARLAQALPFIEDFRFVPRAHGGSAEVPSAAAASARAAEKSLTATLIHLPAGLPEADRQRIENQLAQVRAEIGRNFAARRERQSAAAVAPAPPAPPAPAAPAPATPPRPPLAEDVSCLVRDGDGLSAVRPDSTYGALPDRILEDVMGLAHARPPEAAEKLGRYLELIRADLEIRRRKLMAARSA